MVKKLLYLCCLCALLLVPVAAMAGDDASKRFVLVVDAGHGGHDAGAVGAFSKEKNINLSVALAFGRLVEENCPDVRVIYTRKSDVFVPLQRRADIANNNRADLFISIHTNALPKGRIAYGAETYTLGTARAKANLEVAKRENGVIVYEENYKEVYKGFDPDKTESYIIFEFMQDRYMKQSIDLARCIQRQYVDHAGRRNKGVHQAGFLVLRATSMPSVLTELGFISTPAEEKFLNSKEGVRRMAQSIYNGFVQYRRENDKDVRDKLIPADEPAPARDAKTDDAPAPATSGQAGGDKADARDGKREESGEKPEARGEKREDSDEKREDSDEKSVESDEAGRPVFKVQLFVSDRRLREGDARLKDVPEAGCYRDGGMYKYTAGATAAYAEADRLRRELAPRFKGAFVVAFINGERVNLSDAIRESKKK